MRSRSAAEGRAEAQVGADASGDAGADTGDAPEVLRAAEGHRAVGLPIGDDRLGENGADTGESSQRGDGGGVRVDPLAAALHAPGIDGNDTSHAPRTANGAKTQRPGGK